MEPIVFNPLKHHLRAISEEISKYASTKDENSLDNLLGKVKDSKGISDIYVGDLTVDQIISEVFEFLKEKDIIEYEKYKEYLETYGDIKRRGYYTSIILSDDTKMILRLCEDRDKFVHIHPARYSPNTFRVRTNTLNTAIFTRFIALCRGTSPYDIDTLNAARKKLELSPLPELPSAIRSLLEKFDYYAEQSK